MYVTGSPPPPIITETCVYDNINDLVTHNISWSVEFPTHGIKSSIHIYSWEIAGGCTAANGSSVGRVIIIDCGTDKVIELYPCEDSDYGEI